MRRVDTRMPVSDERPEMLEADYYFVVLHRGYSFPKIGYFLFEFSLARKSDRDPDVSL